nr:hypothetical protein [Thermus altitudinis]
MSFIPHPQGLKGGRAGLREHGGGPLALHMGFLAMLGHVPAHAFPKGVKRPTCSGEVPRAG